MKFKQSHSTIQNILNDVENGNGGGGGSIDPNDYYTKTQADAKFLTQTDASTTYQTMANMSNYQTVSGMSDYATTSDVADTYQTKADMANYLTTATASTTYQTLSGMSDYATTAAISDMATQTWVGQQGYISDADEVPEVTSTDNGKVLTASYTAQGVASYSWETASSGTTDYTQLTNKPTINSVTVTGALTAFDLGLVASSDLASYATQTWVQQQGYLTSAREVPSVGSGDNNKILTAKVISEGASTSTTYEWDTLNVREVPTITSSDNSKVLTAQYYNATGTTTYSWESVLSGATIGNDYIEFANGVRLYVSNTAPTGNIPNGSIGIGFTV